MDPHMVHGVSGFTRSNLGAQQSRLRGGKPALGLPPLDTPVQEVLRSPVGALQRMGEPLVETLPVQEAVHSADKPSPDAGLRILPRPNRLFASVHVLLELGQPIGPQTLL